jgi:hypothetical protein
MKKTIENCSLLNKKAANQTNTLIMRRRYYTLTKIKENAICAEVGVWKGGFSSRILEKEPQELHLIDPWIHQDYIERYYSIKQKKMDAIYKGVVTKFKNDSRVTIHRKLSIKAEFPKEYFDWVYIDGDHNYETVVKDLNYYYPMIKKGGYLCGDDYGWTDKNCPKGPKPAVDEFTEARGLKLEAGFLGNDSKPQFVIHVQ